MQTDINMNADFDGAVFTGVEHQIYFKGTPQEYSHPVAGMQDAKTGKSYQLDEESLKIRLSSVGGDSEFSTEQTEKALSALSALKR